MLTERHQPRRANNKRGAMLAQAGKADEALADCNKAISLGANDGKAFARLAYERLGEDKAAGSCTRAAKPRGPALVASADRPTMRSKGLSRLIR